MFSAAVFPLSLFGIFFLFYFIFPASNYPAQSNIHFITSQFLPSRSDILSKITYIYTKKKKKKEKKRKILARAMIDDISLRDQSRTIVI